MLFLSLLFWAFLASYIVHVLDETLLNGGFVHDQIWPRPSSHNRCRLRHWNGGGYCNGGCLLDRGTNCPVSQAHPVSSPWNEADIELTGPYYTVNLHVPVLNLTHRDRCILQMYFP
jgi:hypothetical protein